MIEKNNTYNELYQEDFGFNTTKFIIDTFNNGIQSQWLGIYLDMDAFYQKMIALGAKPIEIDHCTNYGDVKGISGATVSYKDAILYISHNKTNKKKEKEFRIRVETHLGVNMDDISKEFKEFEIPEEKGNPEIHLLGQNNAGFFTIKGDLKKETLPTLDNYPKSFKDVHDDIINSLENDDLGLYMFSGIPGTGKTSFISSLTSKVDRKFIYIPNDLTSVLDSPDFITFLSGNRGCVLVIEDAENSLQKRGRQGSGAISTILNLTDGLVGQILSIAIIVTYNCDDSLLDEALLRKGRLKYKHHFEKLNIEESNSLFKKLNLDFITEEAMTLGEIYNVRHQNFAIKQTRKVGF